MSTAAGLLRMHRLLCVLLLFTGTAFAAPTPEAPVKRVLLVSTGSRLSPGFNVVDQQVLQTLRAITSVRVEAYAENLDIVRFPDEHSQRIFREYLAARYREQPPDLVVLIFVGSLRNTATSLAQVFPNTPILIAGFTDEEVVPSQMGNLVSGFVQRSDARGSLDLMLRLQPGLRRVVVIGGTAHDDRLKIDGVRNAAAAFKDRVAIEFWDNLAMADLRRAVVALPAGTAILYTPLFRDGAGQTFISADVGRWIGQFASAPVYLMVDQSFGTGAVGGMISGVEAFGKHAGELAARTLTGTASELPPLEVRSDSVPMFDWRALQRWSISEDLLPSGSVVRFKAPSVWQQYGWYIATALVVILLQAATILALALERRSRRRIDIERGRAETEVRQQRRELEHVSRVSVMGELAASLAHELSQPLTAIYANAGAALRFHTQGNDAETREALQDVLKDQTRAAGVVRHMRRFVKKDAADEHGPIQLPDLIRDVLTLVRIDAATHRVEITSDVDPQLRPAWGDRVQLQQVLLNLLMNALDAMSDSSRGGRITITARSVAGMNSIAVSDDGPGLPSEEIERVFEAFYTTKEDGMGMGLSICRAIVRAHGGSLSASNNDHGGATFVFTLPMAAA